MENAALTRLAMPPGYRYICDTKYRRNPIETPNTERSTQMAVVCSIVPVVLLALQLYSYVIIASAIFSWLYAFNVINPRNQFVGMIGQTLYALTEPVYRPIRNVLPAMGGLDLSPIVVLLLLILIQNLITNLSGCYL